jgi:hypothetical protein
VKSVSLAVFQTKPASCEQSPVEPPPLSAPPSSLPLPDPELVDPEPPEVPELPFDPELVDPEPPEVPPLLADPELEPEPEVGPLEEAPEVEPLELPPHPPDCVVPEHACAAPIATAPRSNNDCVRIETSFQKASIALRPPYRSRLPGWFHRSLW